MNSKLRHLLGVCATLAALALPSSARSVGRLAPRPEPANGGLTVQLSTSEVEFVRTDLVAVNAPIDANPPEQVVPLRTPAASKPRAGSATIHSGNLSVGTSGQLSNPSFTAKGRPNRVRSDFTASVAVHNRSGSEQAFSFPTGDLAAKKFVFRLFDAAGTKVWESEATPAQASPVAFPATLGRGQKWHRTVSVPLAPNGAPLAAGTYSLEAMIEGAKPVGAVAWVTITAYTPPPVVTPGIDGLVQRSIVETSGGWTDTDVITINLGRWRTEPVAGANVSVTSLAPAAGSAPFVWAGVTDAQGRFAVDAPPGRYRVIAHKPPGLVTSSSKLFQSAEVLVRAGTRATATLAFAASYHNDVLEESGIKGRVTYPSLVLLDDGWAPPIHDLNFLPNRADGGPDPVPAGASISSAVTTSYPETINVDGGSFIRLVRDWQGTPAPGARVVVTELLDVIVADGPQHGFRWEGVADANGEWRVKTPVGKFRVEVFSPTGNDRFLDASKRDVIVQDGAYTRADLQFGSVYISPALHLDEHARDNRSTPGQPLTVVPAEISGGAAMTGTPALRR